MLGNNGGTSDLDRVLRWYLVSPEMWTPLGSWVVMPKDEEKRKGVDGGVGAENPEVWGF